MGFNNLYSFSKPIVLISKHKNFHRTIKNLILSLHLWFIHNSFINFTLKKLFFS